MQPLLRTVHWFRKQHFHCQVVTEMKSKMVDFSAIHLAFVGFWRLLFSIFLFPQV